MDRKEALDEPLTDLERALLALKPKACSLDRERLMFLAGQASAGSRRERAESSARFWRVTTAVASLAAIGLAFAAIAQPERPVAQTIAHDAAAPRSETTAAVGLHPQPKTAERPAASDHHGGRGVAGDRAWNFPAERPLVSSDAPLNYLQLRRIALTRGIDALPSPPLAEVAASQPLTQQELLEDFLGPQERGSDPDAGEPRFFNWDSLFNKGAHL